MMFKEDCSLGEISERQKNFVDKAWARAVNCGPAVFSLTCFVFLVIFVITNLIFQILGFYFK